MTSIALVDTFASAFRPRDLILNFAVAAIYIASARFGLSLSFLEPFASLIWPPSGIALAAVLIWGLRVVPALAVGAFVANISTGAHPAFAMATAVGNPLEAVVAVLLLRRVLFRIAMTRVSDVLALIFYGACIGTIVSATVGVAALCLSGSLAWSGILMVWLGWWGGDGLGIIIMTPLILCWSQAGLKGWSGRRLAEGAAMIVLVVVVGMGVFILPGPDSEFAHPLTYTAFPLVIWAAFRFGIRGATLSAVIMSMIALQGSVLGRGAFVAEHVTGTLVLLTSYTLVLSITALIISTILAERNHIEGERRQALSRILSGFIPICSNCKSIRQDDDSWVPVEVYVRDRTQAEFSHSICQTCLSELYPEFSDLDGPVISQLP